MRLIEAIIEANHRALAGDASAGLHLADYADELPIAALTCIDPRLNALFPEVLGVTKENFIWLRNAGNIVTEPMSSTVRSLALACAIKGAKEIVVIGHSDCQVCKSSTMKLIEAFQRMGVERSVLPDNLTEFFGLFASEQQNVIKAADLVRRSPLIGAKIPVHGLLVDIGTGKLDWVVNGYQMLGTAMPLNANPESPNNAINALKSMAAFKIGEMKFPETKIGELETKARDWVVKELQPDAKKTTLPPRRSAAPIPAPPPIKVEPPKPDFPVPPPFKTRPKNEAPGRKLFGDWKL